MDNVMQFLFNTNHEQPSILVCILLIVLQWLFPITYTSLGYLSPERVKHTLLLKQLVDALPIAI